MTWFRFFFKGDSGVFPSADAASWQRWSRKMLIVVMMVSICASCERLEGINYLQMIARVSNQFNQWLDGNQQLLAHFQMDIFFILFFIINTFIGDWNIANWLRSASTVTSCMYYRGPWNPDVGSKMWQTVIIWKQTSILFVWRQRGTITRLHFQGALICCHTNTTSIIYKAAIKVPPTQTQVQYSGFESKSTFRVLKWYVVIRKQQ